MLKPGLAKIPCSTAILSAPVPVPTLWPVLALDAGTAKTSYCLEQLRSPFNFPIGQLPLGDVVPKFRCLRLASRATLNRWTSVSVDVIAS